MGLLTLIGLFVGAFGTLVGLGGGFILMPILFYLYPDRPAEELTAISLSVVCLNALSGTLAYARTKRIDFRSGVMFALAAAPGAVLGVFTTQRLERGVFDSLFAGLLILVGLYLAARPAPGREAERGMEDISYNKTLGIGISVLVGFVSSLFGIGGGVIHVPAMVQFLNFPVHIATATSQFILVGTTLTGVIVHLFNGDLAASWNIVLFLAPGTVIGAQIGARLSARVRARWIMRLLAFTLILLGFRLIYSR